MLLSDQITRDGKPITGNNANVWVGQQIDLRKRGHSSFLVANDN